MTLREQIEALHLPWNMSAEGYRWWSAHKERVLALIPRDDDAERHEPRPDYMVTLTDVRGQPVLASPQDTPDIPELYRAAKDLIDFWHGGGFRGNFPEDQMHRLSLAIYPDGHEHQWIDPDSGDGRPRYNDPICFICGRHPE